jgi:hypothetical protein
MSRNFELMKQLGLQMGVTNIPRAGTTPTPDTADRPDVIDAVPIPSIDAGNPSEEIGGEEMVRFILEMFPQGGCAK